MSELPLVTRLELAARWKVSPHTVTAMVRDGRLRPTRICRRLLFTEEEIARAQSGAMRATVTTAAAQPVPRVVHGPSGLSPRGWPR
jgi:hypothetical protein